MKEKMKERNRELLKGFVGATIAAIVIASAVAISSGMSSLLNESVVSIEPMSQLVSGNDTFTVNITIDPSQPIRAVGFDLSFDSSFINATSVAEGDLFAGYSTAFYNGIIDNINGTITGVAGAIIGHGNVSSLGNFAIITFVTSNNSGTSLLNLYNVDVQNETGSVPITVNNGSVTIDAIRPIVEVIYPKGGEIISGSATIKWNATDNIANLNGAIWIQYSNDNGTTWKEIASKLNNTGEYDWDTTTVSDGSECLIMVSANDYVNNTDSNESSTFMIDNTPPKTTCHPSGEMGKNGWYVGNVTITLTATDATSGVNYTRYRINGLWNNYIGTFKISTDGTHIINYYSVDIAGNVESTNSATIKIDKTNPFINIEKPKEGYLYIFDREILSLPFGKIRIIGSITIEADATDATSGMDKVEFYVDGTLKNTDPGAPYEWTWDERAFFGHTIKVAAYDEAGNKSTDELEVAIFNFSD